MRSLLDGIEIKLGDVIDISLEDEIELSHILLCQFKIWMFEYFENLNSGNIGWCIDFNEWLEISKGWKHIGRSQYEKVESSM